MEIKQQSGFMIGNYVTRLFPHEIRRTHLGIAGMNPIPLHDSSSRVQMFCSHLGQKLVVHGVEENQIQSGMEREFGKGNFRIEMPVRARILAVIPRYGQSMGADVIKSNPETVVIYQDISDRNTVGGIGVIILPRHFGFHPYFGFDYKNGAGLQKLRKDEIIEAGTVLLETPTTSETNGYQFGINANVALMTLPEVSEDGVIISESFAERMKFYKYETRFIEFGKDQFPLNIYGDENNYRILPEIGDRIRDDGLLAVLRESDDLMALVDQNRNSTRVVDYIFDTKVHVVGGGVVENIIVTCNDDSQNRITDQTRQLEKYIQATTSFDKRILSIHHEMEKKYGKDNLPYNGDFYLMVREAYIGTNLEGKEKVQKLYRKSQLDHFRVMVVIKKEIKPNFGFKITNLGGCKGVVCGIRKDEDMPVDAEGNRVDVIMDPKAFVNRMTTSGLITHFLTAVARDIVKRIRPKLGIEEKEKKWSAERKIQQLLKTNPDVVRESYEYMMEFLKRATPLQHERYEQERFDSPMALSYLVHSCIDKMYLYTPIEFAPSYADIIPEINRIFKPCRGPVLITKRNGEKVWTKQAVMVGSMYVILLEKIGDDLSAVASGKTQHHGVLAQIGKQDKYSDSIRNQPIKGIGEPDGRLMVAYCPLPFIAELMDRNNNPLVHKEVIANTLSAANPTNIKCLIDRKKFFYGSTKPIQFLEHLSVCSGWKFVYHSHKKTKAKA